MLPRDRALPAPFVPQGARDPEGASMQRAAIDEAVAQLAREGLLEREQAARVAPRLAELLMAPRDTARLAVRIVAALGGLLLAASLLSFIAWHWDELSSAAQLGVVFGALAVLHAGGFWLAVATDRAPAVGGALTAAAMLGLGGAIALVAQVYHLESRWHHGLLAWWLLNVPFVLLARRRLFLLIVAPLFMVWLGCFADAWGEFFHGRYDEATAITFALLGGATALLGASALLRVVRAAPLADLLAPLARLACFGLLFLLAFHDFLSLFFWGATPSDAERFARVSELLVPGLAALAAGGALAGFAAWRGGASGVRSREALDAAFGALAFLLLGTLHAASPGSLHVAANLLIAVGVVGSIVRGVRHGAEADVNLAVAVFVATVLARYFEWTPKGLDLSITFLGAGATLLLVGYVAERARRRLIARVREQKP
ncbi:MAG: DUF2157 domain-containing protein [Planctomycetes bacterium]|nr:DUF2157 domain-containing protein [Planctomycetota bacterium]